MRENDMIRRKYIVGGAVSNAGLGARQVRVIASDATPDRDGDIMVPAGCILDNYRNNPIVLVNHDRSQAVGTAVASIENGRVEALITFAPEGVSELADEYCGLVKAGIVNAVSVGFIPLATEPIKGSRGVRIMKWELLEISFVTVPANARATVIQRSLSKAGRVLSGANAAKLQQAHDAAESCRALVADVLAGAETDDADAGKKLISRRRQYELMIRQDEIRELRASVRVMTRSERQAEIRRLEMEGMK